MSRKGNLVERRCATIDRFKMDPFTFKCFAKKIKPSHWFIVNNFNINRSPAQSMGCHLKSNSVHGTNKLLFQVFVSQNLLFCFALANY